MTATSIPPAEAVLNGTVGHLRERLDIHSAYALASVLNLALGKRLADTDADYAREGAELALGFLRDNAAHEVAVILASWLARRSFPLNYDSPVVSALVARHGDVVFLKSRERPEGSVLH